MALLIMGLMGYIGVANAFDNNREGFILGLGVGMHSSNIEFNYDGSTILDYDRSGLATSFKIGGGISNQFAIYYARYAAWYSAPFSDGITTKDITYTTGISGLGVTYYLTPEQQTGYIFGAYGIGDLAAPFEDGIAPDDGSAMMAGAGYEFSDHIQIEGVILLPSITSADDTLLTIDATSIQLVINYLWY